MLHGKYFISFILFLFSLVIYGQQPPQVMITQPINGSTFDGEQIRVDYTVSGTEPKSAKILIDDRPVQLLTDVKTGENTVVVDVPARSCKISVIVRNDDGESVPAVVNLKRNEQIFKPSLYVLAIGISNYDNPDLRLQFPAKDASDFTQALIRQTGLLYESVDVKLFTDRRATAENIRDGLYWLQTQATSRDIAMIYMAGHGVNNNLGDFYFIPVNGDINRINATCVSYTDIKTTISATAGKLLMFMDACHSGNVLGNAQQRSAIISQAVSELTGADNGPVIFTSSTGRQFSLESSEWNNGAFTRALVEGLNGAAELPDNGTITVKSLDYYISNRVKELTQGRQAPTTIIPGSVPDFPIAVVTVNVNVTVKVESPSAETSGTGRLSAANAFNTGTLTAVKRNVYSNNMKLTKAEVKGLMNMEALRLYKSGISRNMTGNVCLWGGVGLTLVGVSLPYNEKPDGSEEISDAATMSVILGICSIITGITLRTNSKYFIRESVNIYNYGARNTGIELKYGIIGNGIGLALRF